MHFTCIWVDLGWVKTSSVEELLIKAQQQSREKDFYRDLKSKLNTSYFC